MTDKVNCPRKSSKKKGIKDIHDICFSVFEYFIFVILVNNSKALF